MYEIHATYIDWKAWAKVCHNRVGKAREKLYIDFHAYLHTFARYISLFISLRILRFAASRQWLLILQYCSYVRTEFFFYNHFYPLPPFFLSNVATFACLLLMSSVYLCGFRPTGFTKAAQAIPMVCLTSVVWFFSPNFKYRPIYW